jgi:hypothetical protein
MLWFDKKQIMNNIKNLNNEELNSRSVTDFFSFAKYLNNNFQYFDNTDVGDVYKDSKGKGLYSEKDIYNDWLNNR